MDLKERIRSFSTLGKLLSDALAGKDVNIENKLISLSEKQLRTNPWFTQENVLYAIRSIADILTESKLTKWTNSYPDLKNPSDPLKVGLIMAGNIPLVGFHDFLSVLITGNTVVAKTSSKDPDFPVYIGELLCSVNPGFSNRIVFTTSILNNIDSIIATGNNNSSRYFEYYFGKYPNIIRKNRNSIAIIDDSETDSDLKALGRDIFTYFGLGCRNVSKVYLPEGYNIKKLIKNWDTYSDVINHSKYGNNYDYNKAIYLINNEPFTDTGYLLLKEDTRLSSPVSVLHFEYYKTYSDLKYKIEPSKENIQCIVGKNHVPFGKSQSPELWEYADGIDTIEFLLKKKCLGIS
jgi:hypothetical protein